MVSTSTSYYQKLKPLFLQDIERLALKHQVKGSRQPISCINMFTPEGVQVSDFEQQLRGRIVQLGDTLKGGDCVQGVLKIMATMRKEGLGRLEFDREDGTDIGRALKPFMENQNRQVKVDILTYHILVFKTAGSNVLTMQRDPGESKVIPYLPAIFEASALAMSAELCIEGEYLQPIERDVSDEVKESIVEHDNWQEISLLEYVNACLPADKIERVQGPTSEPIVPVKTDKDRKLLWRSAQDSDNQNGETVFQGEMEELYVRQHSDIRILYENLPERARAMVLGQLLSQYKLLWPSDNGYAKARESIDDVTKVGPDSDQRVAGTPEVAAPQTILLANGKIMKRRTNGIAVPLILPSGSIGKLSNQLMWTPWRFLENVTGDQDDEETDVQRQNRLEVFPLSVFPAGVDSDDSGDSDAEGG